MKFLNAVKICALLFGLGIWTSALAADATITFIDNAGANPPAVNDVEDGFRIQRNLNGGAFATIGAIVPASPGVGLTIQVTDTTLVESPTIANKYCYRVVAFNIKGDSPFATTATPGVTDCKTLAQLIAIPAGPTGLLVQ
jgi:hypothetical protein